MIIYTDTDIETPLIFYFFGAFMLCIHSNINIKENPNQVLAQTQFLQFCEEFDKEVTEDEMPTLNTENDWEEYFINAYFEKI
tara:strand:- start:80858 stop:81103 length:246 start_codon:yes stop_codon:yes gene_type:complete